MLRSRLFILIVAVVMLLGLCLPAVVLAAEEPVSEAGVQIVSVAPDMNTYNTVIAGLFIILGVLIVAWARLAGRSPKDALAEIRDVLDKALSAYPAGADLLLRGSLMAIAMLVKRTDTNVDDEGFNKLMELIGSDIRVDSPTGQAAHPQTYDPTAKG
jgi:hypothetical protein